MLRPLIAAVLLRAYLDVGLCSRDKSRSYCVTCNLSAECDVLAFWRSSEAQRLCDLCDLDYGRAIATVQQRALIP